MARYREYHNSNLCHRVSRCLLSLRSSSNIPCTYADTPACKCSLGFYSSTTLLHRTSVRVPVDLAVWPTLWPCRSALGLNTHNWGGRSSGAHERSDGFQAVCSREDPWQKIALRSTAECRRLGELQEAVEEPCRWRENLPMAVLTGMRRVVLDGAAVNFALCSAGVVKDRSCKLASLFSSSRSCAATMTHEGAARED